jgi:hypothetical protein
VGNPGASLVRFLEGSTVVMHHDIGNGPNLHVSGRLSLAIWWGLGYPRFLGNEDFAGERLARFVI